MFVPDFPPPAIIEPVQYAPDPWVAGPNPALVFGVEAARRAQARSLGYIVPELAVLPPVAPPPIRSTVIFKKCQSDGLVEVCDLRKRTVRPIGD